MQEREQPGQGANEASAEAAVSPAPAPIPAPATAPTAAPFGRGAAQTPRAAVDTMPFNRALLATMTPEQRSAIYLNQIRKILIFFAVLAVVGIITGVIVGILGINAIHQTDQGVITPGF